LIFGGLARWPVPNHSTSIQVRIRPPMPIVMRTSALTSMPANRGNVDFVPVSELAESELREDM
jgi:hypothetical protein